MRMLKQIYSYKDIKEGMEGARVRFQYFSDVHLELRESWDSLIPVEADTLVLAGDLGNIRDELTKEALKRLAGRFESVVYVAGNHEYVQEKGEPLWTISQVNEETAKVCSFYPNLHFLHATSWTHKSGLEVCGCTLWSHIPAEAFAHCSASIPDWPHIFPATDTSLAMTGSSSLFAEQFAWLQKVVEKEPKRQCVVVTHYLPTFGLCPPIMGSLSRFAVASDLDAFIERHPNIAAWVCGHWHAVNSLTRGQTQCLLNAISGYPIGNFNNLYAQTFEVCLNPILHS